MVLEKAGLPPMADILIHMNRRRLGHVERIDFARLPRQLLYSQLRDGKRNQGRPRLRFKDVVKRNLKRRAKDRTTLRGLIKVKLLMKQSLSLQETA